MTLLNPPTETEEFQMNNSNPNSNKSIHNINKIINNKDDTGCLNEHFATLGSMRSYKTIQIIHIIIYQIIWWFNPKQIILLIFNYL